jgi:hypothetical protein
MISVRVATMIMLLSREIEEIYDVRKQCYYDEREYCYYDDAEDL